ncbi:MAG TPA: sigma factor-like helix-turn-helix DNA-binding protein [Candidatus Limnocylindrales bacterium]|jgi:DNA-directed RNA polymerase specialized sigma24 family protein|nr:sigma factor-like helix-turn-helix DNA-binding protein [Candidatus Limnocylindrales bacterium]
MDRPQPLEDELIRHLADGVCAALDEALADLPTSARTVFILHDVLGLTVASIAPILGRSPASVDRLAAVAASRVRGAPTPG